MTTMRLSLMFLRMRETKDRVTKKCRYYEKMSNDFSASIREQAQLMSKMITVSRIQKNKHIDYALLEAFSRIGELLCETATLRLKLATQKILRHPSKRYQRKLTKQLINKLVKGLLREQNQCRETVFGKTMLSADLRSTVLSGSEITIFDINQIQSP